jgi:hypothetical protein
MNASLNTTHIWVDKSKFQPRTVSSSVSKMCNVNHDLMSTAQDVFCISTLELTGSAMDKRCGEVLYPIATPRSALLTSSKGLEHNLEVQAT